VWVGLWVGDFGTTLSNLLEINGGPVDVNHLTSPFVRVARLGFTITYKTAGTAKYAEVAQDIIVCGLDCGLKKSTNSVAIRIFIS